MAGGSKSRQILTFKADAALVTAMEGIPNRSGFIRAAIQAALDGVCPLCRGTGVLSPGQRKHWQEFSRRHAVETCADCHEARLVCAGEAPAGGAR